MNLEGIEDGSLRGGNSVEGGFKKRYGPLKDGALVIVQRWRTAEYAAERELSIREYHFLEAGHIELRPRSTNKALKSYLVRPARVGGAQNDVTVGQGRLTGDRRAGDDTQPKHPQEGEIIEVVLAAIRLFNP